HRPIPVTRRLCTLSHIAVRTCGEPVCIITISAAASRLNMVLVELPRPWFVGSSRITIKTTRSLRITPRLEPHTGPRSVCGPARYLPERSQYLREDRREAAKQKGLGELRVRNRTQLAIGAFGRDLRSSVRQWVRRVIR